MTMTDSKRNCKVSSAILLVFFCNYIMVRMYVHCIMTCRQGQRSNRRKCIIFLVGVLPLSLASKMSTVIAWTMPRTKNCRVDSTLQCFNIDVGCGMQQCTAMLTPCVLKNFQIFGRAVPFQHKVRWKHSICSIIYYQYFLIRNNM